VKHQATAQGNFAKYMFLLIFLLACSPERDNPYDPKSDFYINKTQVSGTCKNRVLVPINNARICLSSLDSATSLLQTFTNDSGGYKLSDCPAESVLVIAEKDGFVTESTYRALNVYKSETLNFTLEGLPKFLSTQVISYYCVLNIPPFDSSMLSIKCNIDDDEGQGDIASVFATIDSLPDSLPLFFTSGNSYENFCREESLSDNLDNIIGRDINITVKDRFGNEVNSAPFGLVRIIRNPPEIISPAGLEIVSSQPLLIWTTRQYLFSHTFFCEIYRVPYPLPPVLYHRYENIVTADTTFQVPDSLIPGYHYWQIGVKDNYGNWAKSAEGVFEVRSK
jgi:hypothetical protein